MHCFYLSFRELGPDILCHAEAWLPVAVLRAHIVKHVQGKLAAVMRVLLRRLFCGPAALQVAGVSLQLPGGPIHNVWPLDERAWR